MPTARPDRPPSRPPGRAPARPRRRRRARAPRRDQSRDLDAYIREVVDRLPPLTDDQRDLLALIFRRNHPR